MRLLEDNWCFPDFVCGTSAFTSSVPNLRVLQIPQSKSFWKWGSDADKFRLGCWQNASYVPGYFNKKYNRYNCESQQHISPPIFRNKAGMQNNERRQIETKDGLLCLMAFCMFSVIQPLCPV